MNKKQTEDILLKSKEELVTMLKTVEKDLKRLLIERKAGRLQNVELVGEKKKTLARILTVIRSKESSSV
jgi:ribosomal protein L29